MRRGVLVSMRQHARARMLDIMTLRLFDNKSDTICTRRNMHKIDTSATMMILCNEMDCGCGMFHHQKVTGECGLRSPDTCMKQLRPLCWQHYTDYIVITGDCNQCNTHYSATRSTMATRKKGQLTRHAGQASAWQQKDRTRASEPAPRPEAHVRTTIAPSKFALSTDTPGTDSAGT